MTFGLRATTAENGTALPGVGGINSITVPALPAPPVFSDPSYTFELDDRADPQPSIVVGLPTATHLPGQGQRWRIITQQTGTRRFDISETTGEITYVGPDAADRSVATSYSLEVGCRNIQAGVASLETTQTITINVVSSYSPPTRNANWNPGSIWTANADGSWRTVLSSEAWMTIDIAVGTSGPWAIQSGLSATYRQTTIPSPPRDIEVDDSNRSSGSFRIRGRLADRNTDDSAAIHV